LGIGIWLSDLAGRERERSRLVDAEAAATEAEVTDIRRAGENKSRRRVSYQFTVDGRTWSGAGSLRNRESGNLQRGSLLKVEYLPSDPGRNWIAGRRPGGIPMWAGPLVGSGCILAAFVIWRVMHRQRRLLASGRPAPARVTGTKRVQRGEGKVHQVSYEFQLLSGATRTGSFDKQKNPPPEGSTLTIIYDSDNPARHGRYPFSLYHLK
jgi:hypothetical protein